MQNLNVERIKGDILPKQSSGNICTGRTQDQHMKARPSSPSHACHSGCSHRTQKYLLPAHMMKNQLFATFSVFPHPSWMSKYYCHPILYPISEHLGLWKKVLLGLRKVCSFLTQGKQTQSVEMFPWTHQLRARTKRLRLMLTPTPTLFFFFFN